METDAIRRLIEDLRDDPQPHHEDVRTLCDTLTRVFDQVIVRTADMPDGAEMWVRDRSRRCCARWRFPDGTTLPAPDLFPEEPRCMRRLPIIDLT